MIQEPEKTQYMQWIQKRWAELKARIGKAYVFAAEDAYLKLPNIDCPLFNVQLGTMNDYYSLLIKRIERVEQGM